MRQFLIGATLLLLGVGVLAGCGSESSNPAADSTPASSDPGSPPPPAAPESDGDTGRMSDGEYDLFTQYDDKVISELDQWTSGYVTCATIGQTGDFAGFRECIKEAYSGFEDGLLLAGSNAQDTFDDVDLDCRKKLKAYYSAVSNAWARNKLAHEVADSLDFQGIGVAFKGLPAATKRYSKATLRARDACKPS